ncbi:hypothetical protein [Brachybacterium kimchii]|uniref:Stage II sporulation protein M n=1 Tax=Brachybacterium kimchii TaxID=2942909 RepID=A0ABY4NAA2_9MICO|nr:hypothetical protein [Brachybacterium kimchii]UQN31484.1 hypothetical protein M4486_09490 [Brachybacterium kimchii]
MRIFDSFRTVLRANWYPYLVSNLVVYGTLLMAMIASVYIPGLHEIGHRNTEAFLSSPGSSLVVDAYSSGSIVGPALLTLLSNLLFAALGTTTLPTLIVPFFGVVATIARAIFIGMPYAPTTLEELITVITVSPVLLIEFQAYVLAMLGSIILWRSTFGYRRRNLSSAWEGYLAGVKDNLRLYPMIIILLLVIALVEAVTALFLH